MAQFLDKAKNFVAEKVAHVKKPEADVKDVDLKDISRDSVTYNAQVAVSNLYDHSIPICEISFFFKSAGREIASGTVPDPGSLKNASVVFDEITKCFLDGNHHHWSDIH